MVLCPASKSGPIESVDVGFHLALPAHKELAQIVIAEQTVASPTSASGKTGDPRGFARGLRADPRRADCLRSHHDGTAAGSIRPLHLEITRGEADITQVLRDILALTKLNDADGPRQGQFHLVFEDAWAAPALARPWLAIFVSGRISTLPG
jgi:hypothetical protein